MADLSSSAGPKRSDRISESIQKASIILGLGSAGIILREHAIDPTRTREENIKTGRKAANILMKFNFGLGFTISGGVKVLDMTGIPASEYVVAVATSPITWVGFFIAGRALGYKTHLKKKKARKQLKENTD